MSKDPIGDRFSQRQKKRKLSDLAKRARGTDDIEAEEELLEKTEKVEPIKADQTPNRTAPVDDT